MIIVKIDYVLEDKNVHAETVIQAKNLFDAIGKVSLTLARLASTTDKYVEARDAVPRPTVQ